jgi:hypothetical protein
MDIGTVNLLARMQLAAKRRSATMRVRHASEALLELIEFAGLSDALGVEMEWEAEEREDTRGVEEERQLGNPPV